ncbi:acyl-CoA N-acyltransferase [Xylaria arbuscula]|nr:acyl-CoA N-acyltransferase [Xylaria arbuscula]
MASIRPRRDEDLAACVEILKAVYLKSGYPVAGVDDALEVLRTDNQAWVAKDNGIIIGHVAMNIPPKTYVNVALWLERYPQADVAVLSHLFVDPEKRGRGAATKLVRTVEEEARRKGQRLLILALVKDQDAIRLYRHLGWEQFATTVFRWGEGKEMDAVCLSSPLP